MSGYRYGIFKIIATCNQCGKPVVVNGPSTAPPCPSCGSAVPISPENWAEIVGDYVRDYDDFEPGSGTDGTMMAGDLTIKYSCIRLPPPDPACPDCETNWEVESVRNGADGMLKCTSCGRETPVFPAPGWLTKVVPSALQIFFGERATGSGDDASSAPGSAEPVALACPKCGGGLVATAKSERMMKCGYCGVDVYLPDPVWQRLHPATKAKYWMVRFSNG